MPAAWRRRGFDAERRLVKMLSSNPGNYVFRIPTSGGRAPPHGRTALPDVFMVNNLEGGRVVAFEVKNTSKDRVRIPALQLVKLFKFLDAFKRYKVREAVVAVWFAGRGTWVFRRVAETFPLQDLTVTAEDASDWSPC